MRDYTVVWVSVGDDTCPPMPEAFGYTHVVAEDARAARAQVERCLEGHHVAGVFLGRHTELLSTYPGEIFYCGDQLALQERTYA